MALSAVVQMRGKGVLTLPVELRRKYGFSAGELINVIDLGDGAILLTPTVSQFNRLGDRAAQIIKEEGVSTDELLKTLDEERERYYQEHYAKD